MSNTTTTEEKSHITRTTGGRLGKGIAVIVIIMAIGAGINIAFSDYMHKFPPANQLKVQEVKGPGVVATGVKHVFDLHFVESADLRTLGFNAPAGEPNSNPEFKVKAGDELTFNIIHDGKMPHAFGVVSDPSDPNSIVFSAAIGSANNPQLKGTTKQITFIADKPGTYFYICTVPGHADLGMKGTLIVEAAEAAPGGGAPAKPTGMSHTLDLAFTETADLKTLGFNAPKGEPNANPAIKVKAGDSVTINVVNNGKMPHAFGVVTNPDDPLSAVFNSKIKSPDNPILKGQTGSVTFIADRPGHYFYICTVPGHAAQGMQGDLIVE